MSNREFILALSVALITGLVMTDASRLYHIVVSCSLLMILHHYIGVKAMIAVFIVLSIGLIKEVQDPIFDQLDVVSNLVGSIIGLLFLKD